MKGLGILVNWLWGNIILGLSCEQSFGNMGPRRGKLMRKRSFKERLRYKLDNFFARGGAAIFMALVSLYIGSLLFMGGIRVLVNLWFDGNFDHATDHLWSALLQIMDIGGMENDTASPIYNKVIGITTSILGLTLISTMLAFVTSVFKEKLEDLRQGRSDVIEEDHTLILGFGIRSVEIIRELIEANDSEPDAAVVVLSDTDKEEMDNFFNDTLTERATTRIITRSGSVSSPNFLKRMGVALCKSVIVLNAAQPADPGSVKAQEDYKVLKTIMAILAASDDDNIPPIVAQLYYSRNRELALEISPGNILVLDEEMILSKILVQTSRQPGLSLVYSDLVGFMGNEVYFSEPPKSMLGASFLDAAFYFKQSVPLGIRDFEGTILLNPPKDRVLEEGDDLIILAEDDSTIVYYPKPVMEPEIFPASNEKVSLEQERFLIVGWSKKSPILIREYASYIMPGSSIDVVVKHNSELIQKSFDLICKVYPNLKMSLTQVNMASKAFPLKQQPEKYDNVIILSGEGNNVEIIDSETISLLLKFRHYFKKMEEKTGEEVKTLLLSEVMDSENLEIIQQTGVKDFLISNQFVSKIMAQLSEEPDVNLVYEDLFQSDGSEIYLKPIRLYFDVVPDKVSFGTLMKAAQLRGEVCFGVRIDSEATVEECDYGVHIIPDKDEIFELSFDDKLILLAEDES